MSNFCFAPIHADTRTVELIYTPTYYYIGHFSKFILPDAERISTSSSRSLLLATSFLNEDNQITTVVMNETDEAIDYHLFADMQQVTLSIPAHSMQTLVY